MIPELEAIKQLLYDDWDPIGVNGMAPRDEYDSYAMPVLSLLQGRKSEDEIADYLDWVVVNQMGMTSNRASSRELASRLITLRAESR